MKSTSEFCAEHTARLLMLGTADGCLVRRFFNPNYTKANANHLRIPVLLRPVRPA